MFEYTAHYKVDGAVTCLGGKKPDIYSEEIKFKARDDDRAYRFSMYKALEFAMNGLSNPKTDNTRVTLFSLKKGEENISLEGKRFSSASVDSLSKFLAFTDPKYECGKVLKLFRRRMKRNLDAA